MSVFFCDSNCELDYNRADELKVSLIKMPYTVNGEEFFYDLGRSGSTKDFFDKMRAGAAVKTQALNQNDYIEHFEPVLKSGQDIIYVTFSHKMSATFESMKMAIEELKKTYPQRTVKWVDSYGISMGAGEVVYQAALKHNAGATDDEVISFVEQIRQKMSLYFTVDDLIYLKRGGRLSSFKAMMGTILNLKPIISMVEGALISQEKEKGRKKAIFKMVEKLETDGCDFSYPVIVLDADNFADGEILKELVQEKYPQAQIWRLDIGPVIGCHCGPDTVGITFFRK